MKYYVELEVECTGELTPYHPAVMYLKNGDPGYPEEGGELVDFTVTWNGEDVTDKLDAIQLESLQEQFIENQADADQRGDE
jgi:hypothetical protein